MCTRHGLSLQVGGSVYRFYLEYLQEVQQSFNGPTLFCMITGPYIPHIKASTASCTPKETWKLKRGPLQMIVRYALARCVPQL